MFGIWLLVIHFITGITHICLSSEIGITARSGISDHNINIDLPQHFRKTWSNTQKSQMKLSLVQAKETDIIKIPLEIDEGAIETEIIPYSNFSPPKIYQLAKTKGLVDQRMDKTSHRCTSLQLLDGEFVEVIIKIVKTLNINQLYVVYEVGEDFCLMKGLWSEGIAAYIFHPGSWWMEISKLNYLQYSQHILVGSLEWIEETMKKVKPLYDKCSLNALNTKWIWVSSELASSTARLSSSAVTSLSFTEYMEKVTRSLQEGMRGVLLAQEEATYAA